MRSRSEGLLPQSELLNHGQVAFPFGLAQVPEQIGALADEFEQPAATREVLLVGAHVLGQFHDPGGEQRNLNLGGPGVVVPALELPDQLGLPFSRSDIQTNDLKIQFGQSIEEMEEQLITVTLEKLGGDKKAAADVLGVSLKTLYNRLKYYEDRAARTDVAGSESEEASA